MVRAGGSRYFGGSPRHFRGRPQGLTKLVRAAFRVLRLMSVSKERLQAMNLVNDEPYPIRIDMEMPPFKPGQVVFGSLVPWRGEWYWSGEQKLWGDEAKVDADFVERGR